MCLSTKSYPRNVLHHGLGRGKSPSPKMQASVLSYLVIPHWPKQTHGQAPRLKVYSPPTLRPKQAPSQVQNPWSRKIHHYHWGGVEEWISLHDNPIYGMPSLWFGIKQSFTWTPKVSSSFNKKKRWLCNVTVIFIAVVTCLYLLLGQADWGRNRTSAQSWCCDS